MPNHVHAIVCPLCGHTLSQILHTWKSFTAQRANRLLHRRGAFWQPESYDHLIRTEQDLRNQIRYVVKNPSKAGLRSWPWVGGMDSQPMSHRQDADATDADATAVCAPGQLRSHYAPKTPLHVVDGAKSFHPKPGQRCALLAWNRVENDKRFVAVRRLSEQNNLREAATNLFRFLRELDALNVDLIVAERVPDQGIGAAINDRLLRAAAK
jgi:hypothetical protein